MWRLWVPVETLASSSTVHPTLCVVALRRWDGRRRGLRAVRGRAHRKWQVHERRANNARRALRLVASEYKLALLGRLASFPTCDVRRATCEDVISEELIREFASEALYREAAQRKDVACRRGAFHTEHDTRRVKRCAVTQPSAEIPTPAWELVMDRYRDLVTLFQGCQLGLLISGASRTLGLQDKAALRRVLENRRLPPFRSLRDWCYVVHLLDQFSRAYADDTLGCWALRRGEDPRAYYRLVKRTTGHHWKEVQSMGGAWARATALSVWAPYL